MSSSNYSNFCPKCKTVASITGKVDVSTDGIKIECINCKNGYSLDPRIESLKFTSKNLLNEHLLEEPSFIRSENTYYIDPKTQDRYVFYRKDDDVILIKCHNK